MAYVVIARWLTTAGNADRVRQALEKLTGPSRTEPGCRSYQPLQSLDDPGEFLIYEAYDDEAAYEAHGSSEHFRRYAVEEGIPLLESRERSYYRTLDGEAG
jgi:quinol monooxygenase YgiN